MLIDASAALLSLVGVDVVDVSAVHLFVVVCAVVVVPA